MITCTFEDGGTGKLRHVTVGVIAINLDQSKILLVRRSDKFSEPHKLALPGGFLGRSETIKQAAAREALEETGYKVNGLLLLRINGNPDRPKEDRQNVDFVFVAYLGEKIGSHDFEIDNVELFDLDKLPEKEEFAFDHYENVQLFLRYQKEHFDIPVLE